jgi:hypothetical protein
MGLFDFFKSTHKNKVSKTSGQPQTKGSPKNILERYRMGLSYLDKCGAFDETKFLEYNRIIGNSFSDADIKKQLQNAQQMIRGMEDLKQTLRSTTIEAISTFAELEKSGIDLSKYNI